tara:strand:+ start:21 stop:935 length:915 start_codon:yes stop_codon:yes gene_type:complete
MKLLIVILFIIFGIFYISKKNTFNKMSIKDVIIDNRYKVWTYNPQEMMNYIDNSRYINNNSSKYIPDFLKACNMSVSNSLNNKLYNYIILDNDNLYKYLPDFPINLNTRSKYSMKHICDLIGAMILYKYGGLWLSPGTIFLKRNYNDLYNTMSENDLITFGTINSSNTIGDKTPDNRIIYSKPNSPVIKNYINRLTGIMVGRIDYLHTHVGFEYNPLGESIQLYKYNVSHYIPMQIGTMNVHGRKLQLDDFLGKTPIEYQSDLILISFPYDHLDIETNYEWLKFTKMNSLISSNINIINYLNIF